MTTVEKPRPYKLPDSYCEYRMTEWLVEAKSAGKKEWYYTNDMHLRFPNCGELDQERIDSAVRIDRKGMERICKNAGWRIESMAPAEVYFELWPEGKRKEPDDLGHFIVRIAWHLVPLEPPA